MQIEKFNGVGYSSAAKLNVLFNFFINESQVVRICAPYIQENKCKHI